MKKHGNVESVKLIIDLRPRGFPRARSWSALADRLRLFRAKEYGHVDR